MAACSALELGAALEALDWIQEPMRDGEDAYDQGYEYVRHILLEAWANTKASDRELLAPFLDLLTSIKCDSEVPVKTAVPAGGFRSFRECLEDNNHHVRILQDRALWLWAIVPKWGAARWSVQYLLSAVDIAPQDLCWGGCF